MWSGRKRGDNAKAQNIQIFRVGHRFLPERCILLGSPRNPFKALKIINGLGGFFFPGAFFSVYTHNQSTAVVQVRTNGANVLCLLSHVPDCHKFGSVNAHKRQDRINPPHNANSFNVIN